MFVHVCKWHKICKKSKLIKVNSQEALFALASAILFFWERMTQRWSSLVKDEHQKSERQSQKYQPPWTSLHRGSGCLKSISSGLVCSVCSLCFLVCSPRICSRTESSLFESHLFAGYRHLTMSARSGSSPPGIGSLSDELINS